MPQEGLAQLTVSDHEMSSEKSYCELVPLKRETKQLNIFEELKRVPQEGLEPPSL